MSDLYSVVIPVFNSSRIIAETVRRVHEYFTSSGRSFEIILVNDGSADESWNVVRDIARENHEVVAINLLKNYGQHNANLCGFREAKGTMSSLWTMICRTPEEIGKLIEAAREGGCDLVLGRFETKRHSIIRRVGSRFVGWLNRKVFEVKGDLVLSNFRLIHRDVVDRVCRDNSYAPYIPGLVLKYSARRCNVLVKHHPRVDGKSNYNWRRIIRLVASILFNHSAIPLRCSAAFGFVVAACGFILSIYFLLEALFHGTKAPGWASLAVLLSFFNGVLILMLSVIGEYLGRLLREFGTQRSYEIREVVRG